MLKRKEAAQLSVANIVVYQLFLCVFCLCRGKRIGNMQVDVLFFYGRIGQFLFYFLDEHNKVHIFLFYFIIYLFFLHLLVFGSFVIKLLFLSRK